jgi:hypothetical protein
MNEFLTYVAEFGGGGGIIAFSVWKWVIPFIKKLYNELLELREKCTELEVKIAGLESDLKHTQEQLDYFKGKYMDKVLLRSHGKDKRNGKV